MYTTRQLWRATGAAAAVAVALTVPATAGAAPSKITLLQAKVTRLEKSLAKLNATVKKLQSTVKTTTATAATTQSDVATLKTGLAAVVTTTTSGQARLACFVNATALDFWGNFVFQNPDGSTFADVGISPNYGQGTPNAYVAGINPDCVSSGLFPRFPQVGVSDVEPSNR
jgi:hypothetical protein